jgi:hypothetical protein
MQVLGDGGFAVGGEEVVGAIDDEVRHAGSSRGCQGVAIRFHTDSGTLPSARGGTW